MASARSVAVSPGRLDRPPGDGSHKDAKVLPGPVVVAGVSHVPIMVVILGAVPFGIPTGPVMIAMALVVIAVAIANGDAAEVDADDGARGCGGRECGWQDDKRRGQ